MPEREQAVKSLEMLVLAGVNERLVATELPIEQWSNIEGATPELASLQSRLFGKRLLAKYANAIYGIHQFWTPLGYGVGLYQFTEELDAGRWITPTTLITLTIPALLPIDNRGFTVTEFGYAFGSNFGTNDVFTPIPTPSDTPDDRNGGPAGQGRRCQYVETSVGLSFETYASNAFYGDTGAQDVIIGSGPPITVPLPAIPVPPYVTYAVPPGAYSDVMIHHMERGSYSVGADYHNNWRAYGGKVTFDFTPLQSNPNFIRVDMVIHQQVLTVGVDPSTGIAFVAYTIDRKFTVANGEFNFADYLNTSPSIRTVSDGYQQSIQSYPLSLTAIYRQRVCA